MPVRERATNRVLAREPDVGALGQQRRKGERLGVSEVDSTLRERLDPARQRLAKLAMNGEALGDLEQLLVQGAEPLRGDGRIDVGALGSIELAGCDLRRTLGLVVARLDLPLQLLVDALELAMM